jgi:transposase InsO family protein
MLWHKTQRASDEEIIVALLIKLKMEIHSHNTIGILKLLQPTLDEHGIKIGWNRLHSIRAKYNLLTIRKRKYAITTNSYHRFHKHPNLIKEFIPTAPNQLWVSDITYLRIKDKFCFLSLVTDVYSRFIVGYCLYPTLETKGTINALNMALGSSNDKSMNLIHHSDRGIQYCCDAYTSILEANNIRISMTENGSPYENAIAERVNGILKDNYNLKQIFEDWNSIDSKVHESIYSYNYRKTHKSIEGLTPHQAHQKTGELKRLWKNKKYNEKSIL